jgi:hypothetical protein
MDDNASLADSDRTLYIRSGSVNMFEKTIDSPLICNDNCTFELKEASDTVKTNLSQLNKWISSPS